MHRTALKSRSFAAALATTLAFSAWPGSALAANVTASDPYHWLENRSTNSLGRVAGLRQNFGVSVAVPNGLAGTTATATQGSTVLTLPFSGTTAFPNEFNTTIAANPALYGAWTLAFTNGGNTTTITTPAIQAGLQPMPFAADVRITNVSATSFSWSIPPGAQVDAVRVNLFDRGRLNLAGTSADLVYNATFGPGTTGFTLPATLANGLPLGNTNLYTLEINLLDTASGGVPGPQADLRNRSRLYVDLLPGLTNSVGAFLPVIAPQAGGLPPLNVFNVSAVTPGNLIYVAPAMTLGNFFKTGAGDPNFASVLLPAGLVPNNRYRLLLPSGQGVDVTGGVPYSFAEAGVSGFSIDGTPASLGLDPLNPRPFITGLGFTAAGAFTGSVQAVPEPATWLMWAGALLAAAAWRRRRLRQAACCCRPAD